MQEPLNILKGLADGNRLRVVGALMEHKELCVCQITELLGLATATVSRHMNILQNSGLVYSRKHGRFVFYRIAEPFSDLLGQWLRQELDGSQQIQKDRSDLAHILSYDLEELCKMQKKRFESD